METQYTIVYSYEVPTNFNLQYAHLFGFARSGNLCDRVNILRKCYGDHVTRTYTLYDMVEGKPRIVMGFFV